MKLCTPALFRFLFFITLVIFLTDCTDKCTVTNSYVYYQPVYSTRAELKAAITFKSPEPMAQPGRIYFKDKMLFINESGKGIHIIDNTNPSAPKSLGFLVIPGNFDLAISGNTLYADSYIDLVAFDISDLSNIREINRVEQLFNHGTSMGYSTSNSQLGILTDWRKVETVSIEEDECNKTMQVWGGIYYSNGIAIDAAMASDMAVAPNVITGIGGSMARFTIANKHLYALDSYFMDVVDITVQSDPKPKNEVQLTWQAETLFPVRSSLFIGTRSGMYIYNVEIPAAPALVSKLEHVRSCDPVVVEGDYAYVTLRDGTACGGYANQLDVINVKNPAMPVLEKTYPFKNPHGLGIDQGILFICDGSDGLKIYDATDVHAIQDHPLAQDPKINALDIIPYKNIAMMIGSDGLYQYDYSDLKNIKLVSTLSITRP